MNTHNTWNYSDCFKETTNTTYVGYVFRFLKGEPVKEIYHGEPVDDNQMKNHTFELVGKLIYGLTIAQLREPPAPDVDALIEKHNAHWLKEYHDSVAFSKKHAGLEDWERYCNPVRCIGVLLTGEMVTVTVPDFV